MWQISALQMIDSGIFLFVVVLKQINHLCVIDLQPNKKRKTPLKDD